MFWFSTKIVKKQDKEILLWQFSSALVYKGFKILVVTCESEITDTNIPAPQISPDNLILRACIKGKVDTSNNYTEINERYYQI